MGTALRAVNATNGFECGVDLAICVGPQDMYRQIQMARGLLDIEQLRSRAQARQRLYDQLKPIGEIIAETAIEPYLRTFLAGNDPKAIMLISCSHSLPEGNLSVLVARRVEPDR